MPLRVIGLGKRAVVVKRDFKQDFFLLRKLKQMVEAPGILKIVLSEPVITRKATVPFKAAEPGRHPDPACVDA